MLQRTHRMLLFSPFQEPLSVRPASCCLSCLDLCEANDIIVRQQPIILLLKATLSLHGTHLSKLMPQLHHEALCLLCAQSILFGVSTLYLARQFAVGGSTMGVCWVNLHDPRFFCTGGVSLTTKRRCFALGLCVILAMSGLLNNLKGFACVGAAGVNITSTSLAASTGEANGWN